MLNSKSIAIVIFWVVISVFMGLVAVLVASMSNGNYLAILGLPALIIIGMLFVFNRNLLFLLIIFARVSIDPFIVNSKMGALGLGLVLNLFVIFMAVNVYPTLSLQLKKLLKNSWLVFIVMLLCSLVFSADFINALKITVNIIASGAVFIIGLSLIKNDEDYGKWLRIILLSSVIPIGYALLEKFLGISHFRGTEGYRLQGVFFHPNVLGFYSVLMISVCLLIMKTDIKIFNRLIKNIIPFFAILILAVLLLTKTRSAWVGCFVFIVLYGLFFEKKYLLYMSVIIGVALCIPDVQDRLLNVSEGEAVWGHGQLNSYSWRQLIWHDGLSWMKPSRYIFGYGLDSFKDKSALFFTLYGGQPIGAHNIYVQLFFEVGFLGLAAYIYMNFSLIKYLFKFYYLNKLTSFIAIGLIIEYALFAYSDNMFGYLSFSWIFWFVLGVAISYLDCKSKATINTADTPTKLQPKY